MIKKKNDAVSPVVGVMLMLVVTIVIAALVSSFAGGLGTNAEAQPLITSSVEFGPGNGLLIRATSATASLAYGTDFNVMISSVTNPNTFYLLNAANATTGYQEHFTAGKAIYFNMTNLVDAYDHATTNKIGKATGGESWAGAGWNDLKGRTLVVKFVGSDGSTVYGKANGVVTS